MLQHPRADRETAMQAVSAASMNSAGAYWEVGDMRELSGVIAAAATPVGAEGEIDRNGWSSIANGCSKPAGAMQ